MKRIIILSIIATLSLACSKDALETFPTDAVPSEVVYGDVDNAKAALTGTIAGLGSSGWGGSSHLGFGLTETYLTGDALAEDYVVSGKGNGWIWVAYSYDIKNWFDSVLAQCSTTWNCYYTTINACNELIAASELLSESVEGKYVLGQAYALRALSYHMLAQIYARAYFYYPEDLCVPVYLTPTTSETKGAARSTNKVVYEEVICPDLDNAVTLLKEALDKKITRSSKSEIDYYVANGITARVALAMHNWADAHGAAEEALKGYAGTEALSATEILTGMNDITALKSVMWGEVKTPDNYSMYASFLSQMDAGHDGYANFARRCCTSFLWNQMNSTDARRGWWLGNFDNANYAATGEAIKYCQVKFKFQGDTWLGDYIYMRAEEMLLTAAEAYCQEGNDAQARIYLNKLMDKRDPAYNGDSKSGKALGTLTAGSDGASKTNSLLEEILIQRRIELWGEFGHLFDVKRLGQGFKRVAVEAADNPDFDPASLIKDHDTQTPGTFAWVLLLPQMELDGNPNIVQNPIGDSAE